MADAAEINANLAAISNDLFQYLEVEALGKVKEQVKAIRKLREEVTAIDDKLAAEQQQLEDSFSGLSNLKSVTSLDELHAVVNKLKEEIAAEQQELERLKTKKAEAVDKARQSCEQFQKLSASSKEIEEELRDTCDSSPKAKFRMINNLMMTIFKSDEQNRRVTVIYDSDQCIQRALLVDKENQQESNFNTCQEVWNEFEKKKLH